jgi:hypothetical protein
MKHSTLAKFRLVSLSAMLLGALPLHAADAIEANWIEVCRVANQHTLTVTTADGATVEGVCLAIDVTQISIQTKDQRVVKVARSALSRIDMSKLRGSKGHELRALGHGLRVGLRQGSDWLFSTSAPLGIVTIPGTLAWAAISAPFCALSDLHEKITHEAEKKQQIKVI